MSASRLQNLAINLAMLTLILEFTLSARLLSAIGIPYANEGGPWIAKIHPGTYLIVCALAMRLYAGGSPFLTAWRLFCREKLLALFILSMIYCLVYEAVLARAGGVVMLLDTFLPAGIIGFVLCDMNIAQTAAMIKMMRVLVLINAILALGEAVSGVHFVMDQVLATSRHTEFRSVALYDHPLTGAAATMMGLRIHPDSRREPIRNAFYTLCLFTALLAFGGRVAFFLAVFAGCVVLCRSLFLGLLCGETDAGFITTLPIIPILGLPLVWLAFAKGLGGRLLGHLYWDPSAQTRLAEFHIFRLLRPDQILFGCRRAEMIALLEPLRLTDNVDAIENFWLVAFVILGAFIFTIFIFGVLMLFVWLWQKGNGEGRMILLCLILAASSSNSLGHKSGLLVMLVGMVLVRSRTEMQQGHRKVSRHIAEPFVMLTT